MTKLADECSPDTKKKLNMKINRLKLSLALTCLGAGVAHAQTEADLSNFYTPSYRGQAGTESVLWDDLTVGSAFTNANGANYSSLVAPGGSALANASVSQTTPGAFIIGKASGSAGDIYSYASVNTFTLNYSLSDLGSFPNGIGNVVFQTETFGSELDYSSVLLSYTTA